MRLPYYIAVVLLAYVLLALLAVPVPAQSSGPIYCTQQGVSSAGFTAKTQIIAAPATGTARIFICGYTASCAAACNITFQQGTGSNCVTNSVTFGPTVSIPNNGTFTDESIAFRGLLVNNPNAFCATSSAAANMTVYYNLQ